MAESTYYFDRSEHNKIALEEIEKSLKKFEASNNLRRISISCSFLDEEKGMIEYIAKAGDNVICHCEIHKKNDDSNTWVIPAWFLRKKDIRTTGLERQFLHLPCVI